MDGQNRRGLKWLHLGKFGKRRPTFFQIYGMLKCHLLSWKIILSCYVAMIFQMKDSANLAFRAHNKQN